MNIVLIGARGSGKSAVAAELGQLTGWHVVQTDAEIVERAGCPIPELVAANGWEAFRAIEAEVVRHWAAARQTIVDTGGGVILLPENVAALKAGGRIYWLRADVATLAARIAGDPNRPPLTSAQSAAEEVAAILAERTPIYEAAADAVLDTDTRTPQAIAQRILALHGLAPANTAE